MCIRQGKKGAFKIFSLGAPDTTVSVETESMLILNSPNTDMNERWLEIEMGHLEATTNLTLSLTSV